MSCSVNRKRTKADVNTVIGESDVESSDTSSEDTDATDSETTSSSTGIGTGTGTGTGTGHVSEEELEEANVKKGDWTVVAYCTKKTVKYYIEYCSVTAQCS